MSPWLWMLVGLSLSGLTTWYLLRSIEKRQADQSASLSRMVQNLTRALESAEQEIRAKLTMIEDTLASQPKPPEYPVEPLGAFLPTDQSAAELERAILSSEDRSIAASGVVPYSPPRSKTLRPPFDLASSTRPVRSSGRP